MAYYVVEYGIGPEPQGWGRVSPEIASAVIDGVLCNWDTRRLRDGTYSLRLVVADQHGNYYEAKTAVQVENPSTPPPSPTPQPTASITPTPTTPSTESPDVTPTPVSIVSQDLDTPPRR